MQKISQGLNLLLNRGSLLKTRGVMFNFSQDAHDKSASKTEQQEREFFVKEEMAIRKKIVQRKDDSSQHAKEVTPLQAIFEKYDIKSSEALEEDLLVWKHTDY